jgi:hypothetical protein
VKIIDSECKYTELTAVEGVRLVTWRTFRGEYAARIEGQGIEVTAGADTRAEAIAWLAQCLKALGAELVVKNFEQEGALPFTVGELSGSSTKR